MLKWGHAVYTLRMGCISRWNTGNIWPTQQTCTWNSHENRHGGYARAQPARRRLNKGWCCCHCRLMCSLPWTETNAWTPIWHHSLRRWTDHLLASWLHWATFSLKGPMIHDHTRHIFLVWVCLSNLQGFSQCYEPRACSVFVLWTQEPHKTLWQISELILPEAQEGAHDHRIHWSHLILHTKKFLGTK